MIELKDKSYFELFELLSYNEIRKNKKQIEKIFEEMNLRKVE